MSVLTVISCFAASRASLFRTVLYRAVLGGSIVALGSSVLMRLAMPSPSVVAVGCAGGGALLLTLPAMLSRRYPRPVAGPPTA